MKKAINNTTTSADFCTVFSALELAAFKHRNQRRKGTAGIPYINHPIEVAALLLKTIEAPDNSLIIAAVLHDTLEDTNTSRKEILEKFGEPVLRIVEEMTDNMDLPYTERKKQQIKKAGKISYMAGCIKIADKICNIHDLLYTRIWWLKRRKVAYVRWALLVVNEIKNPHPGLLECFYSKVSEAERILKNKF